MSEPIKSRPMFHSTACERCVFGRAGHAQWCENRPISCEVCGSADVVFKAYKKFYCREHGPTVSIGGMKLNIDDRAPRDLFCQFINLGMWNDAQKKAKG